MTKYWKITRLHYARKTTTGQRCRVDLLSVLRQRFRSVRIGSKGKYPGKCYRNQLCISLPIDRHEEGLVGFAEVLK